MLQAFAEAASDSGIEVGAMLTINTDENLDIAEDLARVAARFAGAGITALGTAGFVEPAGLARFQPAAGSRSRSDCRWSATPARPADRPR